MRPSRFNFLKHLLLAILALVAGVSTLEVGLNVREVLQPPSERLDSAGPADFRDSRVLEKSWTSHHRLKPLQSFSVTGVDGKPVPMTTNSLGLRGREYEIPKPANVYRILCLGDETVLAAETPERDTFCARLQEMLGLQADNGVEVINAGVPGHCPLLSYLAARHELMSLQPDLVLLHVGMNDVADDHRLRRQTATKGGIPVACPHRDLSQSTSRKGLAPWDRFYVVREGRRHLEQVGKNGATSEDRLDIDAPDGRYAWLRDDPPDWSVYVEQALSPIEQLVRLVESHGGRLIVVTSPAPWQVSAEATNAPGARQAAGVPVGTLYRSRRPFEAIASWCTDRSIPLLDLSEAFQREPRPERLFLEQAPRWSVSGHELVAREVAAWISPAMPGLPAAPETPRYLEPPRRAVEMIRPELERR